MATVVALAVNYHVMNEADVSEYQALDLKELAAKIDEAFYRPLPALCEDAYRSAIRLLQKDTSATTSTNIYTNLCVTAVQGAKRCALERSEQLIPYVNELCEKTVNNHNCKNCQNGCQVNHPLQLSLLKESHTVTKDVLQRLDNIAIPLHADMEYPDLYRMLRNEMYLVKNNLLKLFFLEETLLLPQIIKAQKKINAV